MTRAPSAGGNKTQHMLATEAVVAVGGQTAREKEDGNALIGKSLAPPSDHLKG